MSKRTRKILEVLNRFKESIQLILNKQSKHQPTSAAFVKEKLRQVDDKIAEVKGRWAIYASREVNAQFGDASKTASAFFKGLKKQGEAYQKPTARVLENQIITDFYEGLDNGRKQVLRLLRETQQQAIKDSKVTEAARKGLIKGTPKAVKSEILKALEKGVGEGNIIRINGRNYQPDKYAELVARTRVREAQSLAAIQTTLNYGEDLVRVSDHGDTDPTCAQFAGRVFSISGTHPEFDPLEEYPPFHPNCVHVMTPFIESPPDTQRGKDQRESIAKYDKRAAEIDREIRKAGKGNYQEGLRLVANKHAREERQARAEVIRKVKTKQGTRYQLVKDGEKRSGLIKSRSQAEKRASGLLFEEAEKDKESPRG